MDVIHGRMESSQLRSDAGKSRTMSSIEKTEDAPSPYAEDPRWLLVKRILATPDFERSPRLAEFLRYICHLALEGRSDEINEQSLGVAVFGRTPGFDSNADTIVRSHALRLRHRLELYFSSEGVHEPLVLEIPRGGYIPCFRSRENEVTANLENPVKAEALQMDRSLPDTGSQHPSAFRPWLGRWFWLGSSVILTACVAGLALIGSMHYFHKGATLEEQPDTKQTEIQRQFWNSLFPANGRTLIVPGDSGLVIYEALSGQEVNLSDYINHNYSIPSYIKIPSMTGFKAQSLGVISNRYTSIVDLDLSFKLTHLPEWSSERTAIVYARDLRPADAARSNLILLGSRQGNPWISLVEPSMNFVLARSDDGAFYFLNRHPEEGELREYHTKHKPGDLGAEDVYGDVAYLPNPSGTGMVLALSGLWMSGTQSAGRFVLDEPEFSSWLKSIVNADGTIPPFELLISAKNLQGNAVYSTIIAKRVQSK